MLARGGAGAALLPLFSAAQGVSTLAASAGYRVAVRGGFAREIEPGRLEIRALSLQPEFKIKAAEPQVNRLDIDLVNIHGKRTSVESTGIEIIERSDNAIYMMLDFSAGARAEARTAFKLERWEKLDFTAVSDTHLGDPAADAHFSKVLEQINMRRPTFAVDAGDVIDVDEPAQWAVFRQQESLLKTPLFTTIGNHDSYISTRLYRQHLGDLFYSFDIDGCQFLMLDNAQKYNNATLFMSTGERDAQWHWLRRELKRPARHRFVFFHFPAYGNRSMTDEMYMQTTPPADREAEVDRMIQLFVDSGVDYILHGHLHSHRREERGGIVHLRLGGGGGSKASHTKDRDVNIAHLFVDSDGIREYVVYPFFDDTEVEGIEFCELPESIPAGASAPLVVNAKGKDRLLAFIPEIRVAGGPGRVSSGNIFTAGSPGTAVLNASYRGHTAEARVNVTPA